MSPTIAVAGDGRADRLMDVPSREKSKLGFVEHLVPHQEGGQTVRHDFVEEAGDGGANRDGS